MLQFTDDTSKGVISSGVSSSKTVSGQVRLAIQTLPAGGNFPNILGVVNTALNKAYWSMYLDSTGSGALAFTSSITGNTAVSAAANYTCLVGVPTVFGFTWDGATAHLFLNGKMIKSGAVSGTPGTVVSPDELHFGSGLSAGANRGVKGDYQDIKLWDATLSDAEMALEAFNYVPVRTANLYDYWTSLSSTNLTGLGSGRVWTLAGSASADGTDYSQFGSANPSSGGGGITSIR